MTPEELSPTMRRAYESLSENDQAVFLKEQQALRDNMIRGSIARVMVRNQSHNLGDHAMTVKENG